MSGFVLGSALVIAAAGAMMFIAPARVVSRLAIEPLPTDAVSRRIFRIGGGILLALAAILIIQIISE